MSNAKDNSIFDNIKLLGTNIQSDIPAFVKNIREAKSSFEEILKKLKQKESEILAVIEQEKQQLLAEQAAQPQQENVVIAESQPETIDTVVEDIEYTDEQDFKTEEILPVEEEIIDDGQTEKTPEINTEPITETIKPLTEEKTQTKKIAAEKQAKKVKTSEEKFLDSLPKPLEQKNKRIIDITPPKREKPKGDNIRRYTSPEKSDSRQRPQRFDRAQTSPNYKKSATAPVGTNVFAPTPVKPASKFAATTSKTAKKKGEKTFDVDKKEKVMNKRTLIRRGFETDMTLMDDEYNKMGSKKYKIKKKSTDKESPKIVIESATVNTEIIPIKTLSDKLGITAVEITKRLFKEGIIKTINETIDYETAALMAAEMGIELELKLDKTAEDKLAEFHEAEQSVDAELKKRPPIVTVMGHVDHGKTSLLDAIKHSNVAEGEAGGITQQIGAYTVTIKGEQITFIDTPGHEAFTAMRARGASITDIAILVVAADDGIMPQTIEAINHAKAADVPIIVAINKMDKPSANPDRIKQQLTEYGLVPEEWGGDTMICPVSALKREGLDNLLETILLIAEVKELQADPNKKAKGTIIEAKLDKGKGPVATVLVQTGTLKIGDTVVAGVCTGRIRAMIDDKGNNIQEAGPSIAVSVLGFSEVPNAGDPVYAMDNEKLSRLVAEERMDKIRTDMAKTSTMVTLDDVFEKIAEGQIKGLNIILKADLQGSVEAVTQALLKLSTPELKVSIIHGGVGAINESDVRLAQTVMAIIIGFNVRPELKAKQLAERENVDIRLYRIIYDVIDDVEKALKGMLEPVFKEVQTGQAEVRNIFKISGAGTVAGCYVTNGKIIKSAKIRLIRDGVIMMEGNISALKRFKDDVKEVAQGYECGISIENYNDIKENDIIESFIMEEVPQ